MTPAAELLWADTDFPAPQALRLFHREGIRHLPVVRASVGEPVGEAEPPTISAVLSMREILAHLFRLSSQQ